jgi:phage baseplate assembly protein W
MANSTQQREPLNFPLLVVPDERGELHYPRLDASVRQSIRVVLSTRPGEQLMRPDFGAGLENFVHEPNTLVTRRRIRDLVQASLAQWEPRIVLDRVDVSEVQDQPGQIRVEILYRLRRTGAAQQLGLSVNLES